MENIYYCINEDGEEFVMGETALKIWYPHDLLDRLEEDESGKVSQYHTNTGVVQVYRLQ